MALRAAAEGLKTAVVFIGAVIGAGYATGREVVTFFDPLGRGAGVALLAAGALLAGGAAATVLAAAKRGLPDYSALFHATAGRRLGAALDLLATMMLYLICAVTIAGGAATLREQYAFGAAQALTATVLGCGLVAAGGYPLLVRASSWLVPLLVVALLAVVAAAFWRPPGPAPAPEWPKTASLGSNAVAIASPGPAVAPEGAPPQRRAPVHAAHAGLAWAARPRELLAPLAAGALYAAYNLVLAVGVLVAGAASTAGAGGAPSRELQSGLLAGAALGGAGLASLAALVLRSCRIAGYNALTAEVPMAELAKGLGTAGGHLYALILLGAVLTTVGAASTSLAIRLAGPGHQAPGRLAAVLIVLAAFPARAGFARLVQLVYPPLGLLGLLWLWVMLCWPGVQEPPALPPTL